MKNSLLIISASSLLLVGCPFGDNGTSPKTVNSTDEQSVGNGSPQLVEGQTQIDLGEFAPGEARNYTIQSDVPLKIGFQVDLSVQEVEKLRLGKPGDGFQHSARIEEINSAKLFPDSFESLHGGGIEMASFEKTVKFRVSNLLDRPLYILVYRETHSGQ
jgi:hypothetical protein